MTYRMFHGNEVTAYKGKARSIFINTRRMYVFLYVDSVIKYPYNSTIINRRYQT